MSGKLVDTTLLHYFRTKLDTVFAKKSEVGDKNVIEHVQKNGTELTVTNKTVNVTVPTRTSELTNDSGFVTGDSIPTKTSQLTNDSGYITSDDIPTKTSQLTNDSNFVSDANYVHTDNNFTSQDKTKLESVEQGAQVNVIEKVQQNGVDLNIENKTVNVTVPTKTSELENDSDFVTSADIPEGGIVDTELSSTSTNPVQNKAIKQETDKILGNLATIETSPAIANHAVGDYIVYNSQLYKVTSAITSGGTLDGKISEMAVGDFLSSQKDYVVEQVGNTKNGYTKWNSGKLEQYGYETYTTTINIAWGSGYRTGQYRQTYPTTFKKVYTTNFNVYGGGQACWCATNEIGTATTTPSYYLIRVERLTTSTTFYVTYYSVGTWK